MSQSPEEPDPVPAHEPAGPGPSAAPSPCPVVGIGASAGGLEAITQLMRALPSDTDMAFVLVQHLDPSHASMLADLVARVTAMPVAEAAEGVPAERNRVYVIPPNRTLTIAGSVFHLAPRGDSRMPHRPIDDFLRSLAEDSGHRAIGVILSGSATDGTAGLHAIKAEGGLTFAQDATAQHDSMPRSAIAAGCVDFVLPPDGIAGELVRIARHPLVETERGRPDAAAADTALGAVLEQLRHGTGVDFSRYKHTTLQRRIGRRVVLHRLASAADYVGFLRGNPSEVEALYQDILINVTSFFRNPESYEVLKARVFPTLVADRSWDDPVRMWVLGCSTGEEAYSLAIAFTEFAEHLGRTMPVQVFATDLNASGIDRARAGIYPKSIAQDVSPERLRRFFTAANGGYRVNKPLRDACVFARHNALTEPPFSRIDLVSCRNLLIYLDTSLQQRLVPILHYALKPQGYLWLGGSESLGAYRDLFEVTDTRHKIYAKRPGVPRVAGGFGAPRRSGDTPRAAAADRAGEAGGGGGEAAREADRMLLARYAPPSVVINAQMDILHFRGETGPYLAPAPGKASLNLLKMLREGLLVPVRGAVHRAQREARPVREEGLRVRTDAGHRDVDVQVLPLRGGPGRESTYLVLFQEPPANRRAAPEPPAPPPDDADAEPHIDRLKQELAATREYLQSVIEQQEAANEELQTANEEVQSANEELQSTNEELETSKEEIQSSNEELATVNEELQTRNLELSLSNNDLLNLLSSVQVAIVMLGRDFRIRRFTPIAEKVLNLIGPDVGRPLTDLQLSIDVPDLRELLADVMDTVTMVEREVQDRHGRWFSLRLRPYRTVENRIDGVVLMLLDVDASKRQQDALALQAEMLDLTLNPIAVSKLDGPITYWNAAAERVYGFSRAEAVGRASHQLLGSNVPYADIVASLRRGGEWTGEQVQIRRDGQPLIAESRLVRVRDDLVLEAHHVVTERKQLEQALRQRNEELLAADRAKDHFIAMLAHELRNPLQPVSNALRVIQSAGADEPMRQRALDMMHRQVQGMARMIDDLLDLSRITQGHIRLRREPMSLATAIDRAVDLTRHAIEQRQQALVVAPPEEPVWLDGDILRLEQVFGNLLSNASKFAPRRGHIWLTVERPEPTAVVVRVRDDGIGLQPEALGRIFEPFVQFDHSLERRHGGLGIGLSLVRHITELHGGTVDAASAGPGRGFEVAVRLPVLASAPRAVVEPSAAAPVATRSLRILVVDDNADAAESLAMVLRLAGHDVRRAADGPSALQAAMQARPEVAVLDIGLPGIDGYETARRLRRTPGLEDVVLIAVTGYGQDADREAARAVGFEQHYTKPLDPIVLRDSLAALFAAR